MGTKSVSIGTPCVNTPMCINVSESGKKKKTMMIEEEKGEREKINNQGRGKKKREYIREINEDKRMMTISCLKVLIKPLLLPIILHFH